MESNLSSGVADGFKHMTKSKVPSILKQWLRNDKVILFEMTDGLLQVNFFNDHYKLLLYQENSKVS